jgi:ribosomal protein S27AE
MANVFLTRTEEEQELMIADVWCGKCQEYSLGVDEPHEYAGNGVNFLEGKCAECGNTVVLEVAPAAV